MEENKNYPPGTLIEQKKGEDGKWVWRPKEIPAVPKLKTVQKVWLFRLPWDDNGKPGGQHYWIGDYRHIPFASPPIGSGYVVLEEGVWAEEGDKP